VRKRKRRKKIHHRDTEDTEMTREFFPILVARGSFESMAKHRLELESFSVSSVSLW